jgi:hypothetical protein
MKLEMNVARWRNKERKKKYGKQSMKKEWKKGNKSEKNKEIMTEWRKIWEVARFGLSLRGDEDCCLWLEEVFRRFGETIMWIVGTFWQTARRHITKRCSL